MKAYNLLLQRENHVHRNLFEDFRETLLLFQNLKRFQSGQNTRMFFTKASEKNLTIQIGANRVPAGPAHIIGRGAADVRPRTSSTQEQHGRCRAQVTGGSGVLPGSRVPAPCARLEERADVRRSAPTASLCQRLRKSRCCGDRLVCQPVPTSAFFQSPYPRSLRRAFDRMRLRSEQW